MGPNRDGDIPSQTTGPVATTFADQKPPLLWKTVVGYGSAPVVVSGNRVYTYGLFKPGTKPGQVESAESMPVDEDIRHPDVSNPPMVYTNQVPGTPEQEEKDHGAYRGDEYALCLDAQTGKNIWALKLTDWGIGYPANDIWGPLASPLLSTDGKLFIHSITGQLYALDASSGKLIWHVNLFDHQMFRWTEKEGNAAGPLLVGQTLIVGFEGLMEPEHHSCGALAGFDAATGQERWVTKAPFEGFRVMNRRIGFATINGEPTVLDGSGGGTIAVDPATGKIRWSFKTPVDDTGLPFPYANYAPVVWKNYVIDAVSASHDDIQSKVWCVRIDDDKPTLVWQTNDFVPHVEINKSNLLVRDGKFYGFDAHGFWGMKTARAFRGKDVGQFQCRDVLTGKLLWSSNAFLPPEVDSQKWPGEWGSSKSIFVGDNIIVTNPWGLWIARLKADNVEMLATVRQQNQKLLGEPVLVDGRLFIRQRDAQGDAGLNQPLGTSGGNLFCLDLRVKGKP